MIAVWMIYSILVGACLCIACSLVERALIALQKPSRFIWLSGMVVSLAVVFSPLFQFSAPLSRSSSFDSALGSSIAIQSTETAVGDPGFVQSVSSHLTVFDTPLLMFWIASGVIVFGVAVVMIRKARMLVESSEARLLDGIPVRVTQHTGPALAGIVRYEIILPRWTLDLTLPEQQMILRHEEQHAKVFDPVVSFCGLIILAFAAWNAPMWFMMRRLRRAIETDCDRRVLARTSDLKSYAELLVAVVERTSGTPALSIALGQSASQLRHRILAMKRRPDVKARAAALAVFVFGITMLAAAVRSPRPEPPSFTFQSRLSELDSAKIYVEAEVDQPVQSLGGIAPEYPASLRAANVEGEVLLKFVVGTDGEIEKGTVRVQRATNALFREAVLSRLEFARYRPAKINRNAVRQVVEQAFQFRLSPRVVSRITTEATRASENSSAAVVNSLARQFEPAAFDRESTDSWVVGLVIDAAGKVISHSRIKVPDDQPNLRVLYPRLFPNPVEADHAPYQVMSVAQGVAGEKSVQVIGVFMKRPAWDQSRR